MSNGTAEPLAIPAPGTNVPSGSLVTPSGSIGPTGPGGPAGDAEVGSIKAWPSVTPPASWLLADGSAVSRTLYPALFTLIGSTYGAGDGSTTFNLPDMRGRFICGSGAGAGLTNRALAATGGEETHALSIAELASHTHLDYGHTHGLTAWFKYVGSGGSATVSGGTAYGQAADATGSGTAVLTNTGSGTGHNTMPPFLVLVYIIKAAPTGGATAQAPLADSTQPGLLRTVSGASTDYVGGDNACHGLVAAVQPTIWSARLRSFNAISNPNFEVTQRNCGAVVANPTSGAGIEDRWFGYSTISGFQTQSRIGLETSPVVLGTNFAITTTIFRITLNTQKTTLAASDVCEIYQSPEGSVFREIMADVHSVQILARSSVANAKFGLLLCDNPQSRSLTQLCTLGAANTWALIQFPNLPNWVSGGAWRSAPGGVGYVFALVLASGSTGMSPANGVWQAASYYGANGQDNFFSYPVGSTLDIAFVQHEPGAVCTTLIDKPFTQNLDECLRYFQKAAPYGAIPANGGGQAGLWFQFINQATNITLYNGANFPKRMAKTPTCTFWSNTTHTLGQANLAFQGYVGNVPITSYGAADNGIISITVGGSNSAPTVATADWVADTGW